MYILSTNIYLLTCLKINNAYNKLHDQKWVKNASGRAIPSLFTQMKYVQQGLQTNNLFVRPTFFFAASFDNVVILLSNYMAHHGMTDLIKFLNMIDCWSIDRLFNGTSTKKGQFVPTAGRKIGSGN